MADLVMALAILLAAGIAMVLGGVIVSRYEDWKSTWHGDKFY
jgi:predicted MFS family arabinose efflux permease